VAEIQRRDFLKLAGMGLLGAVGAGYLGGDGSHWSPSFGSGATPPPNILVIVFDALSARNMSLYGYPRQTTPNMDRLAEQAIVYHQHHSAGSFTSPGTASLLTGVYPWTHRAVNLRSEMLKPFAERSIFSFLPKEYHRFAYTQNPLAYALLDQLRGSIDDLVKMAELADFNDVYTEAMFESDYFVANESEVFLFKDFYNPPGSLFLSLLDKFKIARQNRRVIQAYKKEYPRGIVGCRVANPGAQCFRLETAIDWAVAQAKSASQPFFGYLHAYPPHEPYNPRAEFSQLFVDDYQPLDKPPFPGDEIKSSKKMLNLRRHDYDQNIAYVDAEFGRLFAALQQAGILENTTLVITSDHGEMFERGVQGHTTAALYEPVTHIPLIVFPPGLQSRKDVFVPTSAVDVLPSLIHQAGGALQPGLEGVGLPELGAPATEAGNDVYVIEAKRSAKAGPFRHATYALLRWPYKLIRYSGYEKLKDGDELYNLDEDAEEMVNLFSPQHPVGRELGEALDERLRQAGAV
jgi:arylsulfatase A-like enzyme